MSELPEGWENTTLGELGTWSSGGTPNKKHPEYYGGEIPWVRTGDLRDNEIHDVEGRITEDGLAASSAKWFPAGSLLVAMYGATIGRTGLLRLPATTNQACAALLADEHTAEIIPFLWKYFQHRLEDFRALGQGGAQPNISQKVIKATDIPLPPLAEQRRIVEKLDQLSARTRAAKDHLTHVQTLATRAKQATLAAAFRGELTKGFEKKQRLSEAVSDMGINGQVPELPNLPAGWAWLSVQSIASVTGGLTKNSKRREMPDTAPYLRVANVYANELRLDDIAEIGCTDKERQRTELKAGDLLVVEGNGSQDQIGRVALWNGEVSGCLHQNHLIKVRPEADVSSNYLLYWLLSPVGRTFIEAIASSSSGLHTLSLTKVKGLPVPACSPEEQTEIVRRIEAAFARIDRMVAKAAKALALLERLEQQLLAKAFRGELVPQDPSDEPASALLARIREARANAPKPKRTRKKT